jgi:intracellular sulfur oxidation DsrE/DsrF family protein
MNACKAKVILILSAMAMLAAVTGAARADDPIKVVYHLSDEQSATLAMFNISNHMTADPGAKIILVALSRGVKVFTFGAQDATSRPFADWVEQLTAKGVEFRVCQNSLNAYKLGNADLVDKVQIVPSGVAEIARLQNREGYAYIRP